MKRTILITYLLCIFAFESVSQVISGTYAIQNVKTGKNLRPLEAGKHDGNKIVLYDHVEWKCMTWDFIESGDNKYQLKNLFTSKTFQPSGEIRSGCGLEQQPLINGNKIQEWEFIPAGQNSYFISLKGSDLFLTISDGRGETNSPVILKPGVQSDDRKWKLIPQNPRF